MGRRMDKFTDIVPINLFLADSVVPSNLFIQAISLRSIISDFSGLAAVSLS